MERTNARGHDRLESLLSTTSADAVILATPSGLHSSQAIAVAASGKHVVTEKPMATRWQDGLAMVRACDALAGGLTANANRASVKLERVVPNRGTTVQDLDLATNEARTVVRDGDVLRVQPNLEQLEGSVRLAGNVFQPGLSQWFEGMRLRDLVPSPELVKPLSDINYVLIRREVAPNVAIEVLSADLQAAWSQPDSAANVALRPRDTVHVFSIEIGRQDVIAPIVDELEAQAAPNTPIPVVRVGGQVHASGEYPLEPGMRISDLLRAGGGMSEAAYATNAELTRYEVIDGEYCETELITVNLAGLLRGDQSADLVVAPYDYLNVKEVSRWRGEESVTIRGEVVFPGTYPIRRGEKLSSVLARAGGLTELAFPEGSVFTREELREREREQLETLASRIRARPRGALGHRSEFGDYDLDGPSAREPVAQLCCEGALGDSPRRHRGRARGGRHRAEERRSARRARRAPGGDGARRGSVRYVARVRSLVESRRVHRQERRLEPAGRSEAHLRGAGERRGRGQRGRLLVPSRRWLGHSARRFDRRAVRHRSAARALKYDYADRLQPGCCRRGRGLVLAATLGSARV